MKYTDMLPYAAKTPKAIKKNVKEDTMRKEVK